MLNGGFMSSRDRVPEQGHIRLNEEDVAYVMNLLRNDTQPVNTQELIDVLRRHPGQFQPTSGSGSDATDEGQT
jgi:hypothetical protein